MSDLRMSDYNTHDCHTMLLLFLAIAIRAINHPYVKMVITRMYHFFNAISKKVINIIELDELCKCHTQFLDQNRIRVACVPRINIATHTDRNSDYSMPNVTNKILLLHEYCLTRD
jgi:hypothetical protein